METQRYSVFVKTDSNACIVSVNSSAFADAEWGIRIDEGTGDKYYHAQGNYFSNGIYTEDGIPRYKLVDGVPVLRTEEEIQADRAAIIPQQSPDAAAMSVLAQTLAQDLPDARALSVPTLYPYWEANIEYGGENQPKIVRRRIETRDQLYRCQSPHTSQAGWEPENVPAIWVAINENNAGTIEDPIPATRGMEYVYGKYYLDPEDEKTYLCKRIGEPEGGTIILHYLPHELIGQYFEEVV